MNNLLFVLPCSLACFGSDYPWVDIDAATTVDSDSDPDSDGVVMVDLMFTGRPRTRWFVFNPHIRASDDQTSVRAELRTPVIDVELDSNGWRSSQSRQQQPTTGCSPVWRLGRTTDWN